jgi:hypothetical protein
MKRLTVLVLLSIFPLLALAQTTFLRVQHPQQTSRYGTGTINDATIVLHPRGTYLQCDLYLLFSAKGLGFTAAESVEVQFDFSLPAGAVVTDLWLWVDNQIMRGLILDRWTASNIYEGIVKRKRDPCLLTKTATNSYSARIYPLKGTGTRRIMISYLLPMKWGLKGTTALLPAYLLKASKYGPPMFRVRWFLEDRFRNPRLIEYPDKPFQVVVDSLAGPVLQTEIPGASQSSQSQMTVSSEFAVDAPLFFSHFRRGNDGYYQAAFLPSRVLEAEIARRLVVLVDYDSLTTSLRSPEILAGLRSTFESNFNSSDSMTIIYRSPKGIDRVSSWLLPCSPEGISAAFSYFQTSPLSPISTLKDLLKAGSSFAKEIVGGGTILLVTASVEYCDPRVANPVLSEIVPLLPAGLAVHVVDFAAPNYRSVYLEGKYYYNNDYFLSNLCKKTGGAYVTPSNTSPSTYLNMLATVVPYLRGPFEALDLYTQVEGGLCTGRFLPSPTSGDVLQWDAPVMQIGRYYGSLPFVAEITALYKGKPMSRTVRISETPEVWGDSTAIQTWVGSRITWLEIQPQTNEIQRQTIDISIAERVLSKSTAFLALEPNDTLRACLTCVDESGGPTGILAGPSAEISQDSLVQAYPNPFNASTVLSVRLPRGVRPEEVALRIVNVLGQTVRTLDASNLNDRTSTRISWDGRNDHGSPLSTGLYLCILATPRGNSTTKLMLIK